MTELLANIIWHALSGAQARFAVGGAAARRYAPGFSPIAAFADPAAPDLDALAPHCAAAEHLYCEGWPGGAPPGWQIEAETTMFRMVWQGGVPAEAALSEAQALVPAHAAQALALAEATRPGPFGPRTLELGDYLGVFDGGRLIAMAGERMQAGRLREVSGVCTDPAFQGRGLARRLMLQLIRRQCLRGETPFLHVMRENTAARALYERMGFRDFREVAVRVIARA